MRYILRILAAFPMICVLISFLACFILAFDYPIVILHAIGSAFAFMIVASQYEDTVRFLVHLFRVISDKTLVYDS